MTLSYDGQISYLKEEKNQLAVSDADLWDLCQNQGQVLSLVEADKTAKLIVHANDGELQKMACGELKEILPLLKDYRLALCMILPLTIKTIKLSRNLLNY
jgi:hypothetical protein